MGAKSLSKGGEGCRIKTQRVTTEHMGMDGPLNELIQDAVHISPLHITGNLRVSQSHSEPRCWLYCVREASSSCLARVDLSGVLCDTMTLLNKWSPTEWSKWEAAAAAAEEWINRWKRAEWCRRPRVTLFQVAECAGVRGAHLPQSAHPRTSRSRILCVNKIRLRDDGTANTASCETTFVQIKMRREKMRCTYLMDTDGADFYSAGVQHT